jgi:hypothetical protein
MFDMVALLAVPAVVVVAGALILVAVRSPLLFTISLVCLLIGAASVASLVDSPLSPSSILVSTVRWMLHCLVSISHKTGCYRSTPPPPPPPWTAVVDLVACPESLFGRGVCTKCCERVRLSPDTHLDCVTCMICDVLTFLSLFAPPQFAQLYIITSRTPHTGLLLDHCLCCNDRCDGARS